MQLGAEAVGQVFELLKGAQSPNPEVQKGSEATLKSLETQPGFCSCLAEIIRNKQAEHSARWLAGIHFKNTIGKHWKARPGHGYALKAAALPPHLRGIVDEEKAHLRGTMMQLISQENAQLAVPVAVAFARVARADYPRHWPSLFQDLTSRLNGSDTLTTRRTFLVLHHILKELASMRLPADRRNFTEVSKMLYKPYWNQWCSDTLELTNGLAEALAAPYQATASPLSVTFERWFLELKGLRRMVLFGSQSDAKSLQQVQGVAELAPAALQTLRAFHGMRPTTVTMRGQLHAMLDRALIKLVKTLKDAQDMHPWSFYHSGCFQQSVEYFSSLLSQPPQLSPSYERFVMQGMAFLHNVRTCKAYQGKPENTVSSGLQAEEQVARVRQMGEDVQRELTAFWEAGHAQTLCRALVHFYFPLTTKELQEWEESGEEFVQQMGIGVWQDSLRGCAETLFSSLLGVNKDAMAGVVLQMLRSTSEACPSGRSSSIGGPTREGHPEAVLAKEAAYNAVGVGSWDLLDHLDFPQWLHSALLPELSDASRENRSLRRRVAIVIAQWAPKLKPQDRPAVYRGLLGLVAEEDFGVSLAGVAALQDLVQDWDFQEEAFMEYVAPCFHLLAQRLQEANELETQIQIFNLLNAILDRLADSVKPFVGTILQVLPGLWQESEGESLLRIQLLMALQRIVNALGLESPSTYPLLIPILQQCTDPHQKDQLNLLEDGLQLWLVALRNAPEANPQLLDLFPNLAAAMEDSTEHVQVGAQLMVSCTLLGGRDRFLVPYGRRLAATLERLLGQLTERGMQLVVPVINVVLQTLPEEGPALLDPALRALLADIQGEGRSTVVVAAALGVFSRMLLQTSAAFFSFFQSLQQSTPGPSPLESYVELWLDRFDGIPLKAGRKLSALALCLLLRYPTPWVLSQLTCIVAHITAVWFETEGSDAPDAYASDFLTAFRPFEMSPDASISVVDSEEAEGEYSRTKALHERDPVNTLKLSDAVKASLPQASAAHGGSAFNDALNALDPPLAAQLQAILRS